MQTGREGSSAAAAPSPFDGIAGEYDSTFTHTTLGRLLRQRVHRRLAELFTAGDRVLEVGCGTGEDALFLARRGVRVTATDAAAAMVEETRAKAAAAGVDRLVAVRRMRLEEAAGLVPEGPAYDGLLANFGVLNCTADLPAAAAALAAPLAPGAPALLCVMGPLVPWEWLWFLLRGRPGRAVRRLCPGGADWRGLAVRYPSARRLRRAFTAPASPVSASPVSASPVSAGPGPLFEAGRLSALGSLLPPPYAEPWAARHPRLIARLACLEERWQRRWPLPQLADHYLLELVRTAEPPPQTG